MLPGGPNHEITATVDTTVFVADATARQAL